MEMKRSFASSSALFIGCRWPSWTGSAGNGHVDGFSFQFRFQRLGLEGGLRFLKLFFDGRADIVGRLAHDGALLWRRACPWTLKRRSARPSCQESARAARPAHWYPTALESASSASCRIFSSCSFINIKLLLVMIHSLAPKGVKNSLPPTKGDERLLFRGTTRIRLTAHSTPITESTRRALLIHSGLSSRENAQTLCSRRLPAPRPLCRCIQAPDNPVSAFFNLSHILA